MKVILLKDTKDGKKHEVINVKSGYGQNYLIRNNIAVPHNKAELRKLEVLRLKLLAQEKLDIIAAEVIKVKIEDLHLAFTLKVNKLNTHGHITRKQIFKSLSSHGVEVNGHDIENVSISNLGLFEVLIHLHPKVVAKLKIEITNDE